MAEWRFYGRTLELQQLADVFTRNRRFFVKITGRTRIGKTTLVRNALSPLPDAFRLLIELTHLDIAAILSMLRDHADASPERLLFLWTLFDGVPKFYRDCYEQNVLAADRRTLLRRIFFESSSPLRTEAENWFLRGLADVEGAALEKLVGEIYEERSRKRLSGFPLTSRITGYWDRSDTEIDLVAVNEEQRRLRFGTCKRSPARLRSDVNNFKGHVERFLETSPRYRSWQIEYVGISPELDDDARSVLARHDVEPQDLNDLTRDLV